MSWLDRLKPRPKHQQTVLIFHRNDCNEPIIHNLPGLWRDEALLGLLEALVQEYYDKHFEPTCEVLWQEDTDCWGEEIDLVLNVRSD